MKEKRPHILITNDDGIDAPGIRHLWQALVDKFDVSIIAPNSEKSGVGLGITLNQPLIAKPVKWEKNTPAWRVFGTPVDCIKIAHSALIDKPIDLIVSGINIGSNHGGNVLYSGTVGATIQGTLIGIPGIAFSCFCMKNPDFETAEKYIFPIVDYVLNNPMSPNTLLNVSFPKVNADQILGIRLARQGRQFWTDNIQKRNHPTDDTPYYWMGCQLNSFNEHEESDALLLNQGYITVVPINVCDLTDYAQLNKHQETFNNLFSFTEVKVR